MQESAAVTAIKTTHCTSQTLGFTQADQQGSLKDLLFYFLFIYFFNFVDLLLSLGLKLFAEYVTMSSEGSSLYPVSQDIL